MLINLRNALMASRRSPLPPGARWVEYLESTGTQWIDTGIPIAPNFYLDATFSIPSSMPHVLTFMGTTTLTQPYYRFWVASIQTNKTINCGLINNALSTATLPADEPHNIYVKFFDGEQLCKLDGTTIVSATNTSNSSAKAAWLAQGNLFIGRSSLNEQFNFIGKIFAVKMYDANGVLVRDFRPIAIGSKGYMLDMVSGQYLQYGNAGTGDFVVGPDVVPVEYIESYAAEYIDTGVIPDDATGVEVVHTICPDNEKDNIIFGARQDSGNTRYWSDIDWGSNDSVGWGFNTYSGSSERFALTSSDVGRKVTNSLNYMNDRAGKIDGVTYDSSLQSKTLATMNRSIYLFGANNMGTIAVRGKFKVYSAKISKGQTLANKFLPVRVGSGSTWEGAMMDVLTRRIYRNAGTGAFSYGNDLPLETLAN